MQPMRSITRPHAATNRERADVTTPLGESPNAELFEDAELPAPLPPVVRITTTVEYRGRKLTITSENMTLDRFCDMLDKRLGVPS